MSSVVDERVVQMSFDNSQFEKGVSQTIGSLKELDNTLEQTSNGEYFDKMEEGIYRVKVAFDVSSAFMLGVLSKLGAEAIQVLKKLENVLTSGIKGGFAEYETQMDATQTILANVKDEGKGIEDVTAALDELNRYADLTIYNFTEMTRNIGMFTAAGTNLDASVSTIKGLANAAALVGANSQTAARAWYQVSQAMAAGVFRLIDWRSLEVSNIAGEGFKSVLTEVARKDGLAVAKMIDNGKALRETLKDNWLTADRFTEAMKILSGELSREDLWGMGYSVEAARKLYDLGQEAMDAATKVKTLGQLIQTTNEQIGSGWAQTFRTIIGDFTKARKFYTRISTTLGDMIGKVSNYRNKFIDIVWNGIGLKGGGSPVDDVKEIFDDILAVISTFIGAVRAGFDNIFPWERIRDGMKKLTGTIKQYTSAMVLNDRQTDTYKTEGGEEVLLESAKEKEERSNLFDLDVVNENITKLIRIFRGLFAGLDIIWITIRDTITWVIDQIPGLSEFFDKLKDGNTGILDSLAELGDKITKFRNVMDAMNLIPNILNLIKKDIITLILTNPILFAIGNTIYTIIQGIVLVAKKMKEMDVSPFTILYGAIKLIAYGIATIVDFIVSLLNKLTTALTGNENFSFIDFIKEKIKELVTFLDGVGKGTITIGDFLDTLKEKFLSFFDTFKNSPVGIILAIGAAVTLLGTVISKVANSINPAAVLKNVASDLSTIATTMKDTGVTMLLNSFGDALLKITISVVAIAIALDKLGTSMYWAIGIVAAFAAVLFILIKKFSEIKTTIKTGMQGGKVDGIKDVLQGWLDFMKELPAQLVSSIATIVKIIGVVFLFNTFVDGIVKIVASIVTLGSLPVEKIQTAAIAISIVIAVLGAMIAVITEESKVLTKQNALSILAMSAVILMMGAAVAIISVGMAQLGALDPGQITAVGFMLVFLVGTIGVVIYNLEKAASQYRNADNTMWAIAGIFVALGVGVGAIVAASSLITSQTQLAAAISTLAMAIVGLVAVVTALGYLTKYTESVTTSKVSQAMVLMGVIATSIGLVTLSFAAAASIMAITGAGMAQMLPLLAVVGEALVASIVILLIVSNSKIDATSAASVAIIAGSIAGTLVLIALALSMLNGVEISPDILNTLAIMGTVILVATALLAILAVVGSEGITEIVVAAFVALGVYLLAIGGLVLMISQAVLNLEQAMKNAYDALMFLGNTETAQSVLDSLTNLADLLTQAAPVLHTLFVAIGEAYVQVVGGFIEGMANKAMDLVTRVGTLILTVLNAIAVWVNQNAATIQSVLVEVFRAIINIALIALNVALYMVLPTLITIIMNLVTQILGFILQAIAYLNSAINGAIADILGSILGEDNPITIFFRCLSEEWLNTKDTIAETVSIMSESFNNLTNLVLDGMALVQSGFDLFTEASTETAETAVENTDTICEADAQLAETSGETTEEIVDDYATQAEASTESMNTQTNNAKGFMDTVLPLMGGFLGNMTDMDLSFFGIDGDNFADFLNNKLALQGEFATNSYNADVEYLNKESALWNQYYGDAGDAVADYYIAMEDMYAAKEAHDMQAMMEAQTAMKEASNKFQEQGVTWDQILGDNVDLDVNSGKIVSKVVKPVYDSWEAMIGDFTSLMNSDSMLGDVDTSAYAADYKETNKASDSSTDTSKLKQELNDRNKMINDADSEIQPKDLTPTIDLDSLKSEVNQANGILTGSLLAAQNAAIGDYINQDSELNPFLKDRWQNTYNFTQNNYSPKALSRIDIYRQTQNQLRLSRGY